MSHFNFDKLPSKEVTDLKKYKKHLPDQSLKNAKKIQQALIEAIIENDLEAFREILLGHLDAVDKENFAKVSGVSLRTIYRMLKRDSNPTIKNVSAVIHALSKVSA